MSSLLAASQISRRALLLSSLALASTIAIAYSNSLGGPFIFDDIPAIVDNLSIRKLSSIGTILSPQLEDAGATVNGRPLVNFSLAINYSFSGKNVTGYHLLNLLIHIAAALTLFGIVRRTLLRPVLGGRYVGISLFLAIAVAALWALHPLQTEAVTYLVQRAESLMGLCYFLAIYGFIRWKDSARSAGWLVVSLISCAAGMACKEVMVSAPVVVLLYDRTFVAGSFRDAWGAGWKYYLGLGASWVLLSWLVAGSGSRGGTAGFGGEITVWHYMLKQCEAISHYLRLVFWPSELVFDYGTAAVSQLGDVWLQAILVLALIFGTFLAIIRWPVMGFLGVWFFALLAPSSSIVPVATQTMAEHRVYLALVTPVILCVAALHRVLERRALVVCAVLALLELSMTMHRNEIYRSEVTLWSDTVAKVPLNSRAHNNLGKAVFASGRVEESIGHYRNAIQLNPAAPEPHYNLGLALARQSHFPEAIREYEEALRLAPAYAAAENNLGNALLETGRVAAAAVHYERAVGFRPNFAEAHSNLANVLVEMDRGPDAILHGREAVRLAPDYAEARYNLGNALARAGQYPPALAQYEAALLINPEFAEAANNLANIFVELGRMQDALHCYERAVRIKPGYAEARRNLAVVLIQLGRAEEALKQLDELVRLNPNDREAKADLDRLQDQLRR